MNLKRPSYRIASAIAACIVVLGLIVAGVAFFQQKAPKNAHAAATVSHYLYTFPDGKMIVYDMDNNHQQVGQAISLPTQNVRGVVANPATATVYISYGGNGGSHGGGSLLAYSVQSNQVLWTKNYTFGVDSMTISPDGKTLYLPDGSQSYDGLWYVLSTTDGTQTGKISTVTGASPHNTLMNLSGTHVYMGSVNNNYLFEADAATNSLIAQIGPLTGAVRPFTIDSTETYAFTTATGFLGFEVSSIPNKSLLYHVPINGFSGSAPGTAPSHGITLSPDNKTIYVIDSPNSYVHVFDVSGLPGTAPKQIADIKLSTTIGQNVSEPAPCTYDCQKEGWLMHSRDGRFVYVGDSGDVIATATQTIVAHLQGLLDGRKYIEIDWQNGQPIFATTRHGVGYGNTPLPGGGNPPGVTPTPPPNTPPGPVNKTWYFGEGRVGSGFREYLTIDNPTPASSCAANIKYLYTIEGSSTPQTKVLTVAIPATSRVTQSVNQDLNIGDAVTPAAAVSAIVSVDTTTPTCPGFMVERPMYFTNYHGLSSGTDVAGSTQLGKSFYFADVPNGGGAKSFLTILNSAALTANVTVNYFANGAQVGTQSLALGALSRGTIDPGTIALPAHSAAVVTSDQPILVERPTYFFSANGMAGAADVVGVQTLGNDWLFAEGYAAANSQETLTIANPNATGTAAVTVTLKSNTGITNPVQVSVPAMNQVLFNVNANDGFGGASSEVSAEVTVTSGPGVVVQREMYYQYHHTLPNGTLATNSITDVVGLPAASIKSTYSFAEGYTRTNYHEWLTVQNPTASAETIYVTLTNGNAQRFVQGYAAPANGRLTVDITAMMQAAQISFSDNVGNTVSMTVQTLNNGGNFLAERPMYFNTAGSSFAVQGGTDIIGYIGG